MTEQVQSTPLNGPKWPKPFLLTRAARETDVLTVVPSKEIDAVKWLARMRWGPGGWEQQACPHCGAIEHHYFRPKQMHWQCRAKLCRRKFHVFTKTKFHGTRRTAREVISILFQFQEAAEGISSRQLGGLHNMSQQAMNVFTHKIREALWQTHNRALLIGEIEADAAYFFKYKRPPNRGTGTSYKMKKEAQEAGLDPDAPEAPDEDKMHALVAFVERGAPGEGGVRVRIAVLKTENQLNLLALAKTFADKDATAYTDEHKGYGLFSGRFKSHRRVLHRKEFRSKDGTHTNMVEGFFAQMRRMQAGAYQRMALGYLELYATEMAWRYEHRRISNLKRLEDLARRCLTSGPSVRFADYWDKRPVDRRIAKPKDRAVAFEIPKGSFGNRRGRPPKRDARMSPTGETRAPGSPAQQQPDVPPPATPET